MFVLGGSESGSVVLKTARLANTRMTSQDGSPSVQLSSIKHASLISQTPTNIISTHLLLYGKTHALIPIVVSRVIDYTSHAREVHAQRCKRKHMTADHTRSPQGYICYNVEMMVIQVIKPLIG